MSNANLSIEEKAFFYSVNESKTPVYEQRFVFDKEIDKEKLRLALKETIKYFVRFGMKAVISKDGIPQLIDNDAPFPIFDDNDQIFNMGTKETNEYLYALCVNGKKLRIIFFHLLCDGRGSGLFTRILFLNYIKLVYGDTEASIEIEKYKLSDESHQKNINDVVVPYVEANIQGEKNEAFEMPKAREVFVVDKEVKNFYDKFYFTTSIECDANMLIDIIHKYDATPFIFFFMLIADSMIENFDVTQEVITTNVAVDLRNFLKSNSFYNFGTSINVDYNTKWHDLIVEDKIKYLKESFYKVLDYKEMVSKLYTVEQMMYKFSEVQNIDWLRDRRKESYGKIINPLFSCFISNVGKTILLDVIKKHIEFDSTMTTPINVVPDYTIFTHNDTCILSQNQNFENDLIMKSVFEKLKSFGIESQYIAQKKMEISHFDTMKLERL